VLAKELSAALVGSASPPEVTEPARWHELPMATVRQPAREVLLGSNCPGRGPAGGGGASNSPCAH
jgi:hypothetical protein